MYTYHHKAYGIGHLDLLTIREEMFEISLSLNRKVFKTEYDCYEEMRSLIFELGRTVTHVAVVSMIRTMFDIDLAYEICARLEGIQLYQVQSDTILVRRFNNTHKWRAFSQISHKGEYVSRDLMRFHGKKIREDELSALCFTYAGLYDPAGEYMEEDFWAALVFPDSEFEKLPDTGVTQN